MYLFVLCPTARTVGVFVLKMTFKIAIFRQTELLSPNSAGAARGESEGVYGEAVLGAAGVV